MRKINACLNHNLAKICSISHQMDKVQAMVQEILPQHLRAHVHVGHLYLGQLLLVCDDVSWMTELNYMLPQLRDRLREEYHFYQLSGIRVKAAMPGQNRQRKSTLPPTMSAVARQGIMESASVINDVAIQTALKNLALGIKER